MGNNYAGFTQFVAQETTDEISAACVIVGVETTLTSADVTIYSPGGSELVARTSATVSAHRALYSRSWDNSTFPKDGGYRARWELVHAGGTEEIDIYFDVVRRRFQSMVGTADLLKLEPRLKNPSSASDLSQFINEAWERITQEASAKLGDYAGNIFFPERFRKAHIYLALGQYFRSVQFGSTGTADADKSKLYFAEGYQEYNRVFKSVSVDLNDDGKIGDNERRQSRSVSAWR